MFGVPLFLFAGLELALRLAGYGFSTSFFKPRQIAGRACLVDNDQFGLRFFPPALARIPTPVVMDAHKRPGTLRIFILGESAALGDPRPHFGAGRYLEALLRERFPGQEFEVVNTAMTAINSHVILQQARECASREGDLWVVYMGNNEMVGPFGAATVFGRKAPPLWLVRTTLQLQKTRLCQFLLGLGRRFEGKEQTTWRGLGLFMENKVPPDDPRRRVVSDNFALNLGDIVQAGLRAGTRVLLSTVAVNLKDCPPFATAATNHLGDTELKTYLETCAQAAAAESTGDFATAKRAYSRALETLPQSAELCYRLGQVCLRLNDPESARKHLQRSVDLDALPFRADSAINDRIRDLGRQIKEPNFTFCDAAAALAAGSPAGVPGEDIFYEHVHFNFDGNYKLALLWAEGLKGMLPTSLNVRAAGAWASQETCDRRLGLTDWNRFSVYEEVLRRLTVPPFSAQLDHAGRLERARAQADVAHQLALAADTNQTRAVYTSALRLAPDDFKLHENFAEFLCDIHDYSAAIEERRKVGELIPHYYFPYFSLGQVLRDAGRLPEALEALHKSAALAPRSGEIHFEMGTVFARQTQWASALAEFETATKLNWNEPRLHLYSGEVLWKLGRVPDAVDQLHEAIRMQPGYWEAHYRLGDVLVSANDIKGAAMEFDQVVRLNPSHVKAHLNLGVALANLGRLAEAAAQADEALRLDPANVGALDFKRRLAGQNRK